MPEAAECLHATSIDVDGSALLIRGPSGAGKSDLALRLISIEPAEFLAPARPVLISDDRSWVTRQGNQIFVSPHDGIAGRIEVRGVGIADVPYCARSELRLIIDLVQSDDIERLPNLADATIAVLGIAIPVVCLAPFEHSAPIKVLFALRALIAPLEDR